MANDKIQNGQAEYGVIHVMEEEMRAAQQGVFEPKSGEAGQGRKSEAAAENKMEAAPTNKAAPKPISREAMTTKSANNPTAKK
jgi:hypothetical protein